MQTAVTPFNDELAGQSQEVPRLSHERRYREAYEANSRLFPHDSPAIAININNRAKATYMQGRPLDAIELLKEAIRIQRAQPKVAPASTEIFSTSDGSTSSRYSAL